MRYSIITINYNNASGLERTIRSVVEQGCKDFEFIVIDGGSHDRSVEIIKENEDSIDFWISESDRGIYHAMNKGTNFAHGDYCLYLNSGDEFYSRDVLEQMSAYNFHEDIVCGNLYIDNRVLNNPDEVTMKLFYKGTLFHQASFIKTELIKKCPYDENLILAADWKFFLYALVLNNATYRHLPITVAKFERGGASERNPEIAKQEMEAELRKVLPLRMKLDYEDYCYGCTPFRKMMNKIDSIPPVRKIIYSINLFVLKILNVKLKIRWIKEL